MRRGFPVVKGSQDPLEMVYRPRGDETRLFGEGRLLVLAPTWSGCVEGVFGRDEIKCTDILMVAAQAGARVLLSDSGVRFALLDATSNERGAA